MSAGELSELKAKFAEELFRSENLLDTWKGESPGVRGNYISRAGRYLDALKRAGYKVEKNEDPGQPAKAKEEPGQVPGGKGK